MVHAVYTVACDLCSATVAFRFDDRPSTRNSARALAVKQGWQRVGGRDLCPKCWDELCKTAEHGSASDT